MAAIGKRGTPNLHLTLNSLYAQLKETLILLHSCRNVSHKSWLTERSNITPAYIHTSLYLALSVWQP